MDLHSIKISQRDYDIKEKSIKIADTDSTLLPGFCLVQFIATKIANSYVIKLKELLLDFI